MTTLVSVSVWLRYIIVAIIQGITEILPISSSGHMLFFQEITGSQVNDLTFEIFLHLASLLAIILFFYKRIILIIKDFCLYLVKIIFRKKIDKVILKEYKGEEPKDPIGETCNKITSNPDGNIIIERRRNFYIGLYIIIATIPAAIAGLLLEKYNIIEEHFTSLLIVGIMLFITGIALLIASFNKGEKHINELKWWQALIIGFFQCFGLFPGISRSGSCLVGASAVKVKKEEAAEFAFLLAIPVIIGANIIKIPQFIDLFNKPLLPVYLTSFVIAFLITFLVIKVFFALIKKQRLDIFSYYCIIMSIIIILFDVLNLGGLL
ncbi:MAG: undecaprenyl-diphosphate phosphatase [Bacillales bacterium]|jgi:undecaprenyl-diphosphatase|nr:undecaprenyl-diphosphate phosphatase [Bacillales bacterium]